MPAPNLTTPQLLTIEPLEYPIVRDITARLHRERWWVNAANHSRTAQDTAHSDGTNYPGFYLVDEPPYRRTEEHVFFERLYATIPASRDEPVVIPYPFPGIADDGFGFGTSRAPQDRVVPARARYDYFLDPRPTPAAVAAATGTASTDVIAASGHPFLDGDRVTFISGTGFTGLTAGTTYFARDVSAGTSFKLAATLGGSAINITVDGSAGVFNRGIPIIPAQRFVEATSGYDIPYVIDAGWGTYGSVPSKSTYLAWMAAQTEFVANASELRQYYGNIWERVTLYIIAQ